MSPAELSPQLQFQQEITEDIAGDNRAGMDFVSPAAVTPSIKPREAARESRRVLRLL